MVLEQELKEALRAVQERFGAQTAQTVERIFRAETAHFTSEQWQRCNSAGMEAVGDTFPWGWKVCKQLWNEVPAYRPVALVPMIDSGKRDVRFLRFATPEAGMMALGQYLQKYRPGRWYSLIKAKQEYYENYLAQIRNRYI